MLDSTITEIETYHEATHNIFNNIYIRDKLKPNLTANKEIYITYLQRLIPLINQLLSQGPPLFYCCHFLLEKFFSVSPWYLLVSPFYI